MCTFMSWWNSPLSQTRVAVIAEMSSELNGTFGGAAWDLKRVRPDGLDADHPVSKYERRKQRQGL